MMSAVICLRLSTEVDDMETAVYNSNLWRCHC